MGTQGNGVAMDQEDTAMAPYSMDLRERVAAAVDHREGSQREIARRFRVSLSFLVGLLQRRREAGAPGSQATRRWTETVLESS